MHDKYLLKTICMNQVKLACYAFPHVIKHDSNVIQLLQNCMINNNTLYIENPLYTWEKNALLSIANPYSDRLLTRQTTAAIDLKHHPIDAASRAPNHIYLLLTSFSNKRQGNKILASIYTICLSGINWVHTSIYVRYLFTF